MVGRKKKQKICDKVSHEEVRISQLPEPLISEILFHLFTKDVVKTSVLSTIWRHLWQFALELDLVRYTSSKDGDIFVERFLNSHIESSIRKVRLSFYRQDRCDISSWINVAARRRIQHLDVEYF
ncbi:putative F-box domain, leucine-rich repeat domain superfamily, F-box-like domain superfamily [Arabidopsis thaliana]